MPIEDANLSNKVLRSCERGILERPTGVCTKSSRLWGVAFCRTIQRRPGALRTIGFAPSLHLSSRRLAALERRERGELVCGVTNRLPQKSPQRFTALSTARFMG
jgi:hypothetical protein